MNRPLALLAAAAVLCISGCGGSAPKASDSTLAQSSYRGAVLGAPAPAPDFSLRDQTGHTVSMASQRGRFTLLTFLYTHCKDVCPLIAAHVNSAVQRLGPAGDDVSVLAVSVDPAGDTAASVRRFVATHRLLPQFRYLTGTAEQLRPVWTAYHVSADPDNKSTAIDHSAYVLLIDPEGVERLLYDSQVKPADIVHDINALKEK